MIDTNPLCRPKIGLFIDADNAPASKVEFIINDLAKYGVITTRRAYGNWQKACLSSWSNCLSSHAIQPMQQFDVVKGKNASDIALVIDVVDFLHVNDINIYAIVSSDSDFTPLVTRIRSTGKLVHGYGERKACDEFVRCCSTFTYIDKPIVKPIPKLVMPITKKTIKGGSRSEPISSITDAISATCKGHGWANVSDVGAYLKSKSNFNCKDYGQLRLGYLIQSLNEIETRYEANRSKMFVRLKNNCGFEHRLTLCHVN